MITREVKSGFRLLPKGLRKCGSCNEVKEKENFYKDSTRASGVSSRCKRCTSEYLKERRKKKGRPDLVTRRVWAESNREHLREQDKKYREANRGRRLISENRRRARKSKLPDTLTYEELDSILDHFERKCSVCKESYEHIDHFIPLITERGGTTSQNIVPMCSICNSSKGGRNPFVWAKSLPKEERDNFDILVKYLAGKNGIKDIKEYEAHVTRCFK